MAEAVWNGFLRLSLVSCPVRLALATSDAHMIKLDQLNSRTGNPVSQQFVDSRTGDVLSGGMEDYRIPGIADTPMIDVHFDQGGFDHVLGGSVGIGEVATVPTSPAVANAIHNATGIRLDALPIRPDRLIAALKGRAAA